MAQELIWESSHLLPDVVVAEEAAHLPLGQGTPRKGVMVARQEVHAQELDVTAVQSATHTHTHTGDHMKAVQP